VVLVVLVVLLSNLATVTLSFWRNPEIKILCKTPEIDARGRHDLYCHFPPQKARQILDLCIILIYINISFNCVRNLVEQLGSIFKLFLFFYGILYP